jgi:GDP-4-dehydro-6-deoxy-D-mannose reductase
VSALAKRIVEAQKIGSSTVAVGTLSARRDYTDVRDVVRAYRALVVDGAAGETYNVCSGHDVAVSDVADRLCALAGADVELVTDPSLVRAVDLPVLRGNCERLTRATRWHPDIPFDQTLADVLAYWRETVT